MVTFSEYTTGTSEQVVQQLHTDQKKGLAASEALKRSGQYGTNELSGHEGNWLLILQRQFTSPFIFLLLAAALLSFILGQLIDGSMVVLFVLINTAIGFYQEYRSENTLKLLKQFVVRRARVIRDGHETITASKELVPGDICIVEPGDVVSADMRILDDTNCMVDESALTGESAPVRKSPKPLHAETKEIFRASNILFSGTTVVSGKGVGVVFAIGAATVMGDISHLATETAHVSSFAKGINRFSSVILRIVLLTLVFIVLANMFIKGSLADLPGLLIFGIALAVSVIPEALPVVMTFSLSRGALHLSKHHVVVKRLSAIEDLGSIEVLCTDKTGTLTENVLSVADVFAPGDSRPVLMASLASPFLAEKEKQPNNAFDLGLWNKLSDREKKELHSYTLVDEVPFDPERRRNSVIVKKGTEQLLIVRGAPEEVRGLCVKETNEVTNVIDRWLAAAGERGQRIIAIAQKKITAKESFDAGMKEKELHFVGLIAFVDPLKKTSKEAVKKAKKLGVIVKILTGDSKEVAGAVARDVGLITVPTEVMTGAEFTALSTEKKRDAVNHFSVFARLSPREKYEIIQLLQKKYEVGFLGEGINDAPALKIANVAIVVQGAADIAQEAADIVLLKKSLQVIVDGIYEGRSVFINTVKYIKATLASNFGNFYAVAIASLLIPFLPMLPLQILLVNLLSDFPMIAIATDTVDTAEMRKPKSYNIKEIVLVATILGLVSTVFDFIMFGMFYRISPEVLQTNWFIGSILTELVFLFSVRSRFFFLKARRPSVVLIWLSAAAFVVTIILPYTPLGQDVFKFTGPSPVHLVLILSIVSIYFIVTESVKLLYYRMARERVLT